MAREKQGGNLPGGNPQSRRLLLGDELRSLRASRKMTADQAGREIDRSGSWVSRIEAGKIGIRVRELHELLDVYGVASLSSRKYLEGLAVEGRQRTCGVRIATLWAKAIRFISDSKTLLSGFLSFRSVWFPVCCRRFRI